MVTPWRAQYLNVKMESITPSESRVIYNRQTNQTKRKQPLLQTILK